MDEAGLQHRRRHVSRSQLVLRLEPHSAASAEALGHFHNGLKERAVYFVAAALHTSSKVETDSAACCSLRLVCSGIVCLFPNSKAGRRRPTRARALLFTTGRGPPRVGGCPDARGVRTRSCPFCAEAPCEPQAGGAMEGGRADDGGGERSRGQEA
eukprot:scaffold245625_cov33-Tisochrysis_lutea.AAC.1